LRSRGELANTLPDFTGFHEMIVQRLTRKDSLPGRL
jgi:hypothetical protein